jgi:hypothetical protein
MKLYTKTIAQTLPDWATVVTKSADLFEIEINDSQPDFQFLLEELETEIEPGFFGVKAGIETNFTKSFLLAASLVQDFSKPLIIVANAGDENTVFCNLYDAATKTKIYREWSRDLDWATIIRDVQTRLAGNSSTVPSTPKLSVVPQPVHPQDLRVKNIRTLLDYPLDLVREWLQFQDVDRPSLLHISKINELVKTMCLAWAADKCEYPNEAESSYQNQVVDAVASGADELTVINAWMQQLQATKAGAM